MQFKTKTILGLFLSFFFTVSAYAANITPTMVEFSKYPAWISLFETPHIKVILNSNQYYLGRLLLVSKTDEKDSDDLFQVIEGTQKIKIYPSMEYVINHRRDVYNELLDVLSALNQGRREWLRKEGLTESPTLFNELTAGNLAYCENRKELIKKKISLEGCRETFHHAHLHSIARYKKQILLSYDKKTRPLIKLSYYNRKKSPVLFKDEFLKVEKNKNTNEIMKVWILFNDTEFVTLLISKRSLFL